MRKIARLMHRCRNQGSNYKVTCGMGHIISKATKGIFKCSVPKSSNKPPYRFSNCTRSKILRCENRLLQPGGCRDGVAQIFRPCCNSFNNLSLIERFGTTSIQILHLQQARTYTADNHQHAYGNQDYQRTKNYADHDIPVRR